MLLVTIKNKWFISLKKKTVTQKNTFRLGFFKEETKSCAICKPWLEYITKTFGERQFFLKNYQENTNQEMIHLITLISNITILNKKD